MNSGMHHAEGSSDKVKLVFFDMRKRELDIRRSRAVGAPLTKQSLDGRSCTPASPLMRTGIRKGLKQRCS